MMQQSFHRLVATALIGLAAAGVVWLATGGYQTGPDLGRTGIRPYTLPLTAGVATDAEIAFYRGRVQKAPDGFMNQNMLAAAYMKKARETGDPAWHALAARAAAASLRAMPQGNPDARLIGAQLAIAEHRFPDARRIIEDLKRRHPTADVDGVFAAIDLAQGRTAEAERRLERIVSGSPTSPAFAQLGLARAARGNDKGAEAAFREAITREQPGERLTSADARTWLGRMWLRRGKLAEAEALFAEASRIYPGHLPAIGLAADVAARRGDFASADDGWKRVEAQRHDPGPTLARARIARAAGRPADAEALWGAAEGRLRAELAKGVVDHRRDLARLLLDRARPGEAAEAERLLAAERKVRGDAETLDLHAGALLALGQAAEASAAVNQLKATGAREAPFIYREAAVARADGRALEAVGLIATANALDPTFRQDPAFEPFKALAP